MTVTVTRPSRYQTAWKYLAAAGGQATAASYDINIYDVYRIQYLQ